MKKSINGDMSYQDLRDALQGTIKVKYGKKSKDGSYYVDYPYV